jgi:hypothetical protein
MRETAKRPLREAAVNGAELKEMQDSCYDDGMVRRRMLCRGSARSRISW